MRLISYLAIFLTSSAMAFAVTHKQGMLEGTVEKIDGAAKTVVVKAVDGSEHTYRFLKRTAVHGAQLTAAGADDAFHGLKEGTHVVVHYTAKGSEETADEFDNIGRDGLKASEGAVTKIDRGTKTIAIKTSDGAEETYRMTASAAKDAGTDVTQGTQKAAKVTIYYSEEGGHKVAHFFKQTF